MAAMATDREDLVGRHRFVPLAERTGRIRSDLDRLQPEVVRSLAPFRGDDYPAAGDGIFAQFRQGVVVGGGVGSRPTDYRQSRHCFKCIDVDLDLRGRRRDVDGDDVEAQGPVVQAVA